MGYRKEDILTAAREIRAHLDELVGQEDAAKVRDQLDAMIAAADRDPRAGTRILALLRPYPLASRWIIQHLDHASQQRGTLRGARLGDLEKGGWERTALARRTGRGPGKEWLGGLSAAPEELPEAAEPAMQAEEEPAMLAEEEPAMLAEEEPATQAEEIRVGFEGSGPDVLSDGVEVHLDYEGAGPDVLSDGVEVHVDYEGAGPGLLSDGGAGDDPGVSLARTDDQPYPRIGGGDGEPSPSPEGQAQPEDQRFFRAELEDHPADQPLVKDEQYTAAFSVGPPSATAVAQRKFPDEILAAADKAIEVFDLTVQVDSDDFEIFGAATRPLRVPRTGRSLGKARFDIAPRRDGDCRLAASVHYQGNFVHQMELTIPVGVGAEAPVAVSTRGRPPESTAELKPRDIALLVEPAAPQGFSCTALGSVGGRAVLPITATELTAAVDAAREAMMSVISTRSSNGEPIFQTRIDIPPEAQQSALRTLARAGARLFQQLFLHPAAGADAKRVGEWLRGYAMNPGLRLTIQIFADHAPLPWAMLYLGDASEGSELSWDNFLGMRHIVEQLPLQMSLGTVDNEILSTPRLAVSVNVNTSIDPSLGITLVAEHQKYWKKTATDRAGLALLSRSQKREVVSALADGHTGDQVVYFYCHATAGGNSGPDHAAIIMSRNDSVTVADLNIDAPTTVQLPGNPLVFINACESAELSPLFYNGFVPYFMAKGARGVIGTECKTPVLFAIEWADAFFDRFLDGAAVGETVLELRRDFLRNHGNPLGLIYAVHCDADTRISPALARAKERAQQK